MEQRRKYKIQPASVWEQVRRDYLAGDGARAVAERHGVGVEALRARASREGWSRYLQPPTAPADGGCAALAALFDGLPDAPTDDPADLARAATQASGRAMRDGDWSRANVLAALAERYRKLVGPDDARRNALTPDTAPLKLVVDILMDEDLPNRRLAGHPDKDPDPVAVPYHRWRQRRTRQSLEFQHAQVARRCACDRRIAALEAQLAAAGLTPEAEDDRARRIRLGQDMHISPLGKVVSKEDWERSLDDEG